MGGPEHRVRGLKLGEEAAATFLQGILEKSPH